MFSVCILSALQHSIAQEKTVSVIDSPRESDTLTQKKSNKKETANVVKKQKPLRVALLGDTFFTNPKMPGSKTLEAKLKRLASLKKNPPIIKNFSRTDMTTAEAVDILPDVLVWKPDVVVIHLGSTDLALKIQLYDILANLNKLAYNLSHYKVQVMMYGLERPANLFNIFDFNTELAERYIVGLEEVYQKIAVSYPIIYHTSLTDSFKDNSFYYMPNRIHPNPRGTEQIARELLYEIVKIATYFDSKVMMHNLTYTPPLTVALLGDRLLSSYNGYEDISYQFLMEQYIKRVRQKKNITIRNFSRSDQTLRGVKKSRWFLNYLEKSPPAAMIVQLGFNDMSRGFAVFPVVEDMSHVIELIKKHEVVPLLLGVKKININEFGNSMTMGKAEKFARYRAIFSYIGKKHKIPYISNIGKYAPDYILGRKITIPKKESMQRIVKRSWLELEPYIIAKELAIRKANAKEINGK